MHKKFLMLALAAVAAAMFIVPATASAKTGECAFTGVTGSITPGVMLMGGGGSYTFATSDPQTTQCEENHGVPQNSKIVSAGTFVNQICGTGTATGTTAATTVDLGADGGTPEIQGVAYVIDFTAAQGQLRISQIEGVAEAGGNDIDGHVTIVPTGGSCTAETGVTQFTVAGAFTVEGSW